MNLPAFPRSLARVIATLPAWPPARAFALVANHAAWPGLSELDWSNSYESRFCLNVRDLGLQLNFSLHKDGFRAERGGKADVTFSANARDFALLALRLEDPDTLFFSRRLLIEGNTDLGLATKNLLDSLELDVLMQRMPPLAAASMRLLRWVLERREASPPSLQI